ncbi:hypothetical protein HYY75_02165, partial [bacterium]|nr:hypothetical protein [bacterium]
MKDSQTPSLFPDEKIEQTQTQTQTQTQNEKASSSNYSSPASPKLKPINRRQMIFRYVEIEKLIPEEHEARAIWEFVGRLDLSRYYEDIRSKDGSAGRPDFDP